MTLNADIAPFDCLLRAEYLYNLESHHGEFLPCTVFGLASIPGRAVGFHVLVHDTGACIWRLPVSALVHKADAPDIPLDHLQLWDCLSYEVTVIEFDHLAGRLCQVVLKNGQKFAGRNVLTIDWHGSGYAESASDSGHKCGHMIALENGCYCIQPNNRILWADPATTNEPFRVKPDYKTNTHTWICENSSRWGTTDEMFYDTVSGEKKAELLEELREAVKDRQDGYATISERLNAWIEKSGSVNQDDFQIGEEPVQSSPPVTPTTADRIRATGEVTGDDLQLASVTAEDRGYPRAEYDGERIHVLLEPATVKPNQILVQDRHVSIEALNGRIVSIHITRVEDLMLNGVQGKSDSRSVSYSALRDAIDVDLSKLNPSLLPDRINTWGNLSVTRLKNGDVFSVYIHRVTDLIGKTLKEIRGRREASSMSMEFTDWEGK